VFYSACTCVYVYAHFWECMCVPVSLELQVTLRQSNVSKHGE